MNISFAKNLSKIPFIKHCFCGRNGGYSSEIFESLNVGLNRDDDNYIVLKNREKIATFFGQKSLLIPHQIHSNVTYFVSSLEDSIPDCDALITNQANIFIGVNTADCVPILLCDIEKKYIAAIHSGWRGAVSGIVENTISAMHKLGCKNIIGAIGPCIHQKSFEIGEEVLTNLSAQEQSKYIKDRHFDLPLFVLDKLSAYGIMDIKQIGVDTYSNNEYFSYRRNTNLGYNQKCGVQFSGIVITENNDE